MGASRDVSQQCPTSSWMITTSPVRSCVPTEPATCPGVMFPTTIPYSRICGHATGITPVILMPFSSSNLTL